MRLWSLHPKYLDSKGLVALWREALLAQKVIHSPAGAYSNHPQLERFRALPEPKLAISQYLEAVYQESCRRAYHSDEGRIWQTGHGAPLMAVTEGQLGYELEHLAAKLNQRDKSPLVKLPGNGLPEPHLSFEIVPGPEASWERVREK